MKELSLNTVWCLRGQFIVFSAGTSFSDHPGPTVTLHLSASASRLSCFLTLPSATWRSSLVPSSDSSRSDKCPQLRASTDSQTEEAKVTRLYQLGGGYTLNCVILSFGTKEVQRGRTLWDALEARVEQKGFEPNFAGMVRFRQDMGGRMLWVSSA